MKVATPNDRLCVDKQPSAEKEDAIQGRNREREATPDFKVAKDRLPVLLGADAVDG